ncbi:MAG TPA: SRPBCC family protein, partial [Acidimicrobiia bacterium]|nr:SRPBCC family protein [Acidimicrobiia bacterium]
GATVGALYRRVVAGDVTVDLRLGRSVRALGPLTVTIDAPRPIVWEVLAAPYVGHPPASLRKKIEVLERGRDLVVAVHRTPVRRDLVTKTVESVRFEEPDTVTFRLLRGPVPDVRETFSLDDQDGATRLDYHGELGTDLWWVGRLWGNIVARQWERTVESSMAEIRDRAEERARRQRGRGPSSRPD